ncbi:hypothetical protein RB608_24810 [Nocardioides sp. LHD-245]|uniref:hypothetical protein n=1 Tax=Nocardioides sp. LHD-245 TaxID=3051387 RepID=UPI0027DED6FD|nr:hypothetical protein [Nocardioides sp. LHD-245]
MTESSMTGRRGSQPVQDSTNDTEASTDLTTWRYDDLLEKLRRIEEAEDWPASAMKTETAVGRELKRRGVCEDSRRVYGCPPWCVRWDHYAEVFVDGDSALHYGPTFGAFTPQALGDGLLTVDALSDEAEDLDAPSLRRLAADALAAAEWMDPSPAPEQRDVDELRRLLDLLESYTSNDQKARYLLTCNWLRNRLARRQSDAELMDALYVRLTGKGAAA